MAAPRAYATTTRFDIIPGQLTQFQISYQCIVGDGVNPGVDFWGTLTYDATLTPAQNLTAAKTKIASDCAAVGFAGLVNTSILINITLQ